MIPLKYSLRNFSARKLTAGVTVAGIALVVFVFTAVLMMAFGIQKTLRSTGSENNIMILRKASNGEISSLIGGDIVNIIKTMDKYIEVGSDGKQILSAEAVAVLNLDRKGGGLSNISLRGVSPEVRKLRPQIKLVEGNWFEEGQKQLVVGRSVAERFENSGIGGTIRVAGQPWKIVGIFDGDGSGFDSEVWGDCTLLLNALNRGSTVSNVTFKAKDPALIGELKKELDLDKRLNQFEPKIETKFFEEQSEGLAMFIRILGIFITVVFSLGSIIGASITMYTSVANRTVEIGTLRALGFKRRNVLLAFLIEALAIAFTGGVLGIIIASFLQFLSISTINFQSFSELEFSFALTPDIIINSLIFALAMGFIGGFLPAVRASRLNIVNALRG